MKKLLLFVLPVLLLAGCQGNGVKEPKTMRVTSVEKEMINHCNDFSFSLLAQVAVNETRENIILSPLSASMLLGMMMNGADGQTLAEMQNVTGFGKDYSMEDINAYYRQLIDVLPALDTHTRLNIANGIWVREDFPVRDTFVQACKKNFDAQATNVPSFTDPKVLSDINSFAAQKTNNRIKKVIDERMVNDNTVMTLLNALYFKAFWADKFSKTDTRSQNFTTLGGKQIKTDMMFQEAELNYSEGADYQLVELPYKGDKYCADIVLPAKDLDINKWLKTLNAEKWQQMLRHDRPEVSLSLPKFSISYNRSLNDDLKALGMKEAFDALNADFSRLSERSVFVSLINQYTFMQVDEEGTEAAAVSVGIFAEKSMPSHKTFTADRPFLFVIRERDHGTILFTALIGHPEWQKE